MIGVNGNVTGNLWTREKPMNISFDDCRKVGVVSGMTEGQIYIFGEERAQILPCWMLIVHVGKYHFFWPVLHTYYEKMAVTPGRWDWAPYWQDLLIDKEKFSFVCGKTYKFQLPFNDMREYIWTLEDRSVANIEQCIRKDYEKYSVELLPDQFGDIECCRIVLADSSHIPQLYVGKKIYIASNDDPDQDSIECTGFMKWEYVSTYSRRVPNIGTIVHFAPTIAVELDGEDKVKNRWIGQEILADWKNFHDERIIKDGNDQSETKKLHGVKARIGGLCLTRYNTKKLEISFCPEE